MNNSTSRIPDDVLTTFPVLDGANFIRQLASPVPIVPDTTFDIYKTIGNGFVALVSTDYPDPTRQSRELKEISGAHQLEFINLNIPRSDSTITIQDHDDMDGSFLVKNNKTYYYLANIKGL